MIWNDQSQKVPTMLEKPLTSELSKNEPKRLLSQQRLVIPTGIRRFGDIHTKPGRLKDHSGRGQTRTCLRMIDVCVHNAQVDFDLSFIDDSLCQRGQKALEQPWLHSWHDLRSLASQIYPDFLRPNEFAHEIPHLGKVMSCGIVLALLMGCQAWYYEIKATLNVKEWWCCTHVSWGNGFEAVWGVHALVTLITLNCAAEVLRLAPLEQRSQCEVQFLAFKVFNPIASSVSRTILFQEAKLSRSDNMKR